MTKPARHASILMVAIECPCCGKIFEFDAPELEESEGGLSHIRNEDRFILCDDCGELFDSGAILFTCTSKPAK